MKKTKNQEAHPQVDLKNQNPRGPSGLQDCPRNKKRKDHAWRKSAVAEMPETVVQKWRFLPSVLVVLVVMLATNSRSLMNSFPRPLKGIIQ